MSGLDLFLLEIFGISSLLIIMFIYSVISADMMTNMITLSIFLLLLIPLYIALNNLQLIVFNYGLENLEYFKIIKFFCNFLCIFIGAFLIIQLIYLIVYS